VASPMTDALRAGAARVTRSSRAAGRALSDLVWRPLTDEDEKALAAQHDAERGLDRPRELRAKEAHEHAQGAPVVPWLVTRRA
jgi:hypothetical protein